MIIEIAHFAFVLAFILALVQSFHGLAGNQSTTLRASIASFFLCALAFIGLTHAYVTSDFSVINVIANSHSLKPLLYKVTGVWGNHEGSMLLWILMLSLFGVAIALWPKINDEILRQRALGFQGLLATGFIGFSLITSNPFLRTAMPPADGRSLNPVLQDPGLALHPPGLYLGYVGFSAVFSLACAGLLLGQIDKNWARIAKPFVALAWMALSAGIALGSHWAYYELGWGGWWYWDPVENASLLPWISGTALLHCLCVLEKRDSLKRWSVFLSLITFSLSLLGTFLVRSGILSSVHAFASDPARGAFILALLVFYCGGGLALYAWRAPLLKTIKLYSPVSRESAILGNNLILMAIMATILTGTLYPIILDVLGLGQISVGPPYYNATVLVMAIPLLFLMGAGPLLPWKRPGNWHFKNTLTITAFFIIIFAHFFESLPLALSAGLWVICTSMAYAYQQRKNFNFKTLSVVLGHLGLGIAVIGMVGAGVLKKEDIRVMKTGDQFSLGRYEIKLQSVNDVVGVNYGAQEAKFQVNDFSVVAQRRWYPVSNSETTEAGIKLSLLDDVYIVLGEKTEKDGTPAWVVRTSIHPLISLLWGGFAMIVLAGLIMLRKT